MTVAERVLLIDALYLATQHWSNQGDRADGAARKAAYGIADEFSALREKLAKSPLGKELS